MRHIPRQSERDVRMHESPTIHTHPHSFASAHTPHTHINGSAVVPSTPGGMSNGSGHAMVSPAAVPISVPNGVVAAPSNMIHKLSVANEQTWLLIGRVAEQMGDLEHALSAYENALRHNPMSMSGLQQVAGISRIKENYPKAVEYFQRVLAIEEENGEIWSSLGHCYLMQDDLQKAYSAYQQALYLLPNPKEDPKLWYGIGILYDRYGSLDHAEEAFSSVLGMEGELEFDKVNEINFRLGIIYKQQSKYDDSLRCFDRILRNPPSPLAHADIWFQIGHVYEQQKDHERAKDAYERVVADNPAHAKVLQQLGWLYHQDGSSFQNQDLAIQYLTKSLEADSQDAQSWYLLGRAYMAGQKYNKAYEAYQQAVYRDGRNPTFWCSIGVLYFQINQFRDALDAYSRAIRINPYISEVWFDLGSLYESCNNQISDAIDAYARASELDPGNPVISQRLQLLKTAQATGGQLPAAPGPQDVHPTAYASAVVPPPGLTGPPLMLQTSGNRPIFRTDSRGPPDGGLPLPSHHTLTSGRNSPGPFRGGPPPPVILDESRHMPSQTPLAPMVDPDRVDRYSGPGRDGPSRGPSNHQSLLLHQPVPQQIADDIRPHAHHADYLPRPLRMPSGSASPPNRARSPPFPPPLHSRYSQPSGPAQPSAVPSQRSPRAYTHEGGRPADSEPPWDRRGAPSEHSRDWERGERRGRHNGEYSAPPPPPPPPPQQPQYHPSRPSSPPQPQRGYSPGPSPRSAHPARTYWDNKAPSGASTYANSPTHPDQGHRRFDPLGREDRVNERSERGHPSPGEMRSVSQNAPPRLINSNVPRSESPQPPAASEPKRRKPAKDKDAADPASPAPPGPDGPKKERKKRTTARKPKDDQAGGEPPKSFVGERGSASLPSFKGQSKGTPEPLSSNGSGSSNRPSPPGPAVRPPSRVVDDNYDEPGVAETLMGLASYRAPDAHAALASNGAGAHSPTVSSGGGRPASPRRSVSHRDSVSSSASRSRHSPPSRANSLKRPLSTGPDDNGDSKRSRIDTVMRRPSPGSGGRHTPVPSTRPSPIPFRTQPSHSPEVRQESQPYPPSPPLPAVLPPHPRPIGAGLSHISNNNSGPINLPPIATLSPASTAPSHPSPAANGSDERMQVDSAPRSASPSSRSKLSEVIHHSHSRSLSSGTPPTRASASPASSGRNQEKMEVSS